jgi:hypothetical protein
MNIKRIIREEIDDSLDWIKDIKPIPELKLGTCFIDVMDSDKTEWIIIDFKMTPGGTHIVVIKDKKNNTDIRHKHEGYFEEDLLSGRYKPCSNEKSLREEIDDFDWVKEQDPITELLDTHYRDIWGDDEELIYVAMSQDFQKLFGILNLISIRKTNKTYWRMIDDYHPVKELFSYEDFKNKDIWQSVKNYYQSKMKAHIDKNS